ncbi:MAG: hypothetical protein KF796_20735 [Ramlibacter sp.]|nr:hypothetical protein [Ramlibacter sp.]
MTLQTVNVLFDATAPSGALIAGARVRARLTGYEADGTLIVPAIVEGITGLDGTVVLPLWANTRGARGTQYEVSINSEGRSLFAGLIVVSEAAPEDQPVPMRLLLQASPPPTVDAAQQALQQLQAAQVEIASAVASLSRFTRLAAGPVGGSKVLRYAADGAVDVASADTPAHRSVLAGVSLTAASAAAQPVTYQRAGLISDSGWAWVEQQPVFAGLNGQLTQAYNPAWSWVCIVGVAVNATTVHLTFDPPILQV